MTPKSQSEMDTYAFKLHVNIKQFLEIHDISTKSVETVEVAEDRVMIVKIPMMVNSTYCTLSYFKESDYRDEECKYDNGGYFIITDAKAGYSAGISRQQ